VTAASRAFAAMLKVPPALTRDVVVEPDVAIPAPDGASLLTDVYLARSPEPLPAILMRSPYGRRAVLGALATWLALTLGMLGASAAQASATAAGTGTEVEGRA